MILICTVCEKEMEAMKKSKKYCSQECENKARNKRKQLGLLNQNKFCVICEKEFTVDNKNANQRQYCYECLPKGITATRGYYMKLIKQKFGNKCTICGYNKSINALEFHHLNPNIKEGGVSNTNGTIIKSLEEAKKCILICSNCHREIHDNTIQIPKNLLIERGSNNDTICETRTSNQIDEL